MTELTEIKDKLFDILETKNVKELKNRLFNISIKNDYKYFEQICLEVSTLEDDFLQPVFQYYLSDRKNLKQDYTPKSLTKLISVLAGNSDLVVDICAGSGALTIQKWEENKNQKFLLYELDENVLPFLIFNMAIRNIECLIYQADVLNKKVFRVFEIKKGEKFGKVSELNDVCNF